MAADSTDKLSKSKDLFSTTLSAGINDSTGTIPLNSVSGLPTDTGVILTIDAVDSQGNDTPNLREVVVGVVSGSNLTTSTRGVEGTAQAHSSGAVVTMVPTMTHWNRAMDAILAGHSNPSGNHAFAINYDSNGNEVIEFATTASAVNHIKVIPAASGSNVAISAAGTGSGSNRAIDFYDSNGNEIIKTVSTASAVNEITVTNKATGNGPVIAATGDDTNIDLNLTPKGTGAGQWNTKTVRQQDQSGNNVTVDPMQRNEGFQGLDFVQTGLVSTTSSGLTAAISAGTYYIAGKRYTYAGGTKLLTASKDCYLDIDTSGTITSVEVANGATSGMTLTANSIRIAKVVTGASTISSHNTGTTLSTAFDALGNRIRRFSPLDRIIGIATNTSDVFAANTTDTSLAVPVKAIVPTGVPIRVTLRARSFALNTAGDQSAAAKLFEGAAVSGTVIQDALIAPGAVIRGDCPLHLERKYIPAAGGTLDFNASAVGSSTTGFRARASSDSPITLTVELA